MIHKLFLHLASSVLIIGCVQTKKGSGIISTESRTIVGDFDKINVSGPFEVIITEGTNSGKVKIETDDNILQDVVVENISNTLKVRFKTNSLNRGYKVLKVYITAKDLNSLTLSGSGEIVQAGTNKVDDFKVVVSGSGEIQTNADADKVSLTLSGSGDILVSGKADEVIATVSGSGDIEAGDLKARRGTVTVSGSADVVVYASKEAKGTVSGSGDIVFKGNPSNFEQRVSGSGSVSR